MASGPYRLGHGGLIDRSRPIAFRFNGKELAGFAGDTLASALLANGVRTVARSFKLHRPRGVFSAGLEEPNALLRLHSGALAIASARAPVVPLGAGLEAHSQTGWPGVSFDVLRLFDLLAPLFAAGFYNKTFLWPGWEFYEPVIRRLAGLGRAPREPDPDRYDVRNAHCDVLVVGGGVAGLEAALVAGRAGERVMLVEQDTQLGGRALWDRSEVAGTPATKWLPQALRELEACVDVRLMPGTLAVGCYDHNVVTAVEAVAGHGDSLVGERQRDVRAQTARADIREQGGRTGSRADSGRGEVRERSTPRERYWIVRPRRIVLATGGIEQPLVFANNDRPGVMLAGAAHRYLACQAVAPGRRIAIATNNDSAYALATDLIAAGIAPVAFIDSRERPPEELSTRLQQRAVPVHAGCMPVDTRGFAALSSIVIGRCVAGQAPGQEQRIDCDALLVSGGWNPALHLFAQAGGKLTYSEDSRALVPANTVGGIDIAGRAAPSGAASGLAASVSAASAVAANGAAPVGPRICATGSTSRQWVDLLHDVTVADIELAVRENFAAIEHVKRYTTAGMSADQGKTSSPLTVEVTARLRGCNPAELGYTTLRPPFSPTSLGAIAGRGLGERFAPTRTSPLHAWHASHGAILEHYGEWQRPAVYRRTDIESRAAAIRRECRTVRTAVGLFDGAPLGKIEVHGPDARELLDRLYINNLATLQSGRVRYGLMLRDSGVIYDDGTVVELAPDRLLVTTTSGNAGSVAAWLEEWRQCEWPQLRVAVFPVTDQWATLTLAGPSARAVLARLRPECDLSNTAFPHFALRETRLLGGPARIGRISFSGELCYEISVPPDSATQAWEALLNEGRGFDIAPYGLEAVLRLRLEKGYLHVGTDTDGTTVPDDVGWGRIAAAKTRDFVGRRSLSLPENRRPDRLQLVGLAGAAPLPVGAHLKLPQSRDVTDGWITSAGVTALEGQPIALALLRSGRKYVGATEVAVHDGGRVVGQARVVSAQFYDPSGARMNA